MLNFVNRTFTYQCDAKLSESHRKFRTSLVRPKLELYQLQLILIARDPYQQYQINSTEMIQRRAARWVKQEYGITSVNAILNNLEWSIAIYCLNVASVADSSFFQVFTPRPSQPSIIRIPQHYQPSTLTHYTRHTHHLHYIPPSTSITYFQKSFFPRTITLIGIIQLPDIN